MVRRSRARGKEPRRLRGGKRFHAAMRREWREAAARDAAVGNPLFEKAIELLRQRRGLRKRGRMDLFIEETDGYVSVVEFKRTNWDRMTRGRVRANACRHARQVWSYVEKYVEDGADVCPAIIYAGAPRKPGRRALVEGSLNEKLIQVVWHRE